MVVRAPVSIQKGLGTAGAEVSGADSSRGEAEHELAKKALRGGCARGHRRGLALEKKGDLGSRGASGEGRLETNRRAVVACSEEERCFE